MKSALLLCALLALLTGCDTANQEQFRIAGAAASTADRARVRSVLRSVAAQTALVERTADSRAPGTLAFYTQRVAQDSRLELGARTVADAVIVDLSAGFGPKSPEFSRARLLLAPELTRVFGSRAQALDYAHRER